MDKYITNNINNCYFEIIENSEKFLFELKNGIPFGDSYLMLKNRKTGKRILKKIHNSKAQLSLSEINEFNELGIFDIYLMINILGKTYLNKIRFNSQNLNKKLIDHENSRIFASFKNNYSHISFNYYENNFIANILEFKEDEDGFVVYGVIEFFDDCDFDCIELRINSKDFRMDVPCTYERNSNEVKFKSKIRFDLSEDYFYNIFKLELKVKKDDIVLNQSKIKGYYLDEKSISNGYILGVFEDTSDLNDELCCAFYLNYDSNLYCIVINKNDIDKFTRNQKLLHEFYYRNSKKPTVFFESFHGKFYSGQPKYIYEKMLEMGYDKTFDFIWAYDGDVEIPGNPLYVRHNSKDYKTFLKKANYLVSNIDFPILKRDNQIYLQTTHGIPYKHLGVDIDSSNSKLKKGRVVLESFTWNYLISPCDYADRTFRRAFEYDGVVINKGYPANDVFYQDNSNRIVELKNKFHIDKDKKVILYAPTFRDYHVDIDNNVNFELLLDLKKFHENLSDEYVLILRLHYIQSENLDLSGEISDSIIDLSNLDDITDLYLISDILITDYSSSFFDFAHSKKPILFFVPDFERYYNFRGLYQEVKEDLPGKEITDNDELINCIKNIDEYNEKYSEKYELFYNKYCSLGHGTACSDVINIVFGDEINE